MKRAIGLGAVVVLVFVAVLIARFPARWAAGFLPQGVECQQISGSVWHGICLGLVAQGTMVGNVNWTLRPTRLLMGKLHGFVDVRGLQAKGAYPIALGDYRISFASSLKEPVGQIKDLSGPLAFNGTLRVTPEPGFILDGSVAARPGAPPELVRQLQFLGTPDAQGARPFSVAGTF